MKIFDSFLTWAILLAIVAVIVGSGGTDRTIREVGNWISGLINIILAPDSGASSQKT